VRCVVEGKWWRFQIIIDESRGYEEKRDWKRREGREGERTVRWSVSASAPAILSGHAE
jgi:hypothetical protein